MEVFAFREENVGKFERFSRNFTNTRAEDTSREVDAVSMLDTDSGAQAVLSRWPTAASPSFQKERSPRRGCNVTRTAKNHGAVKQSP